MVNDLTEDGIREIFESKIEVLPGNLPSQKDLLISRLEMFNSWLFSDNETLEYFKYKSDLFFFNWLEFLAPDEIILLMLDFESSFKKSDKELFESDQMKNDFFINHLDQFSSQLLDYVRQYIKSYDYSKPVLSFIYLLIEFKKFSTLHQSHSSLLGDHSGIQFFSSKINAEFKKLTIEYGNSNCHNIDGFYFAMVTNSVENFINLIEVKGDKAKHEIWIDRFYDIFKVEHVPNLRIDGLMISIESSFCLTYLDRLEGTYPSIQVQRIDKVSVVIYSLNRLVANDKLTCSLGTIEEFAKSVFSDGKSRYDPSFDFVWKDMSKKEFLNLLLKWKNELHPNILRFSHQIPLALNWKMKPETLRSHLKK